MFSFVENYKEVFNPYKMEKNNSKIRLVTIGLLFSTLCVGGVIVYKNGLIIGNNEAATNLNSNERTGKINTSINLTVNQTESFDQSPITLKATKSLEDSISFASGATKLGPIGRSKAQEILNNFNGDTQQLYLYGYAGSLKNKEKQMSLAKSRAISTKIYMVNNLNANPKDITVVHPKHYLLKDVLPENAKQVKTVIKNK